MYGWYVTLFLHVREKNDEAADVEKHGVEDCDVEKHEASSNEGVIGKKLLSLRNDDLAS